MSFPYFPNQMFVFLDLHAWPGKNRTNNWSELNGAVDENIYMNWSSVLPLVHRPVHAFA